jgi:hypothetical protein
MSKLIVALVVLLLQTNCNNQRSKIDMKKQYSCIWEEAKKNKVEEYGIEFRKQLSDTFTYWVNNIDNSFMRRYKKTRYEVSEYFFFNMDNTKGIGFIIQNRLDGEVLDFIDIITGEKNNSSNWEFYYTGVPSVSFEQYGDSIQKLNPITKVNMERSVLEMLVEDGYYKKDCKRDYRYFDKQWFPEWVKKKHKAEFYKSD